MTPAEYRKIIEVEDDKILEHYIRNEELFSDLENPLRSDLSNYNATYMQRHVATSSCIYGESLESAIQLLTDFQEELADKVTNPSFSTEIEVESYTDYDEVNIEFVGCNASWYIPKRYIAGKGRMAADVAFVEAIKETAGEDFRNPRLLSDNKDIMDAFLAEQISFETLVSIVCPVGITLIK